MKTRMQASRRGDDGGQERKIRSSAHESDVRRTCGAHGHAVSWKSTYEKTNEDLSLAPRRDRTEVTEWATGVEVRHHGVTALFRAS